MNGEYKRAEDLMVSPFDHGFLYGIGFFETFRTYDGYVFLYKEHMTRLKKALHEYNIHFPYKDKELLEVIRNLDEAAGGTDGYFRLNVSAGMHDIGLAPTHYESPNVILFRKELVVPKAGTSKKGVWLETTRNEPESIVRHKSHHFLNNVGGRLEIPSLKEWEGLFLTKDGAVAEGITSNVFWVKERCIYTPAIETGILPGTTRAFLIRLAKKIGFKVEEGFYPKEAVELAEEVFVTNAVQELIPLREISGHFLLGSEGPVYQKLHKAYQQAINERRA